MLAPVAAPGTAPRWHVPLAYRAVKVGQLDGSADVERCRRRPLPRSQCGSRRPEVQRLREKFKGPSVRECSPTRNGPIWTVPPAGPEHFRKSRSSDGTLIARDVRQPCLRTNAAWGRCCSRRSHLPDQAEAVHVLGEGQPGEHLRWSDWITGELNRRESARNDCAHLGPWVLLPSTRHV